MHDFSQFVLLIPLQSENGGSDNGFTLSQPVGKRVFHQEEVSSARMLLLLLLLLKRWHAHNVQCTTLLMQVSDTGHEN